MDQEHHWGAGEAFLSVCTAFILVCLDAGWLGKYLYMCRWGWESCLCLVYARVSMFEKGLAAATGERHVYVSGQALDSTSLRTSQALWGGPISSHHTPCQWLVSPPVDWWFSVSMAGCSGVYWVTPGAFLVGPIIVGLQTTILIYTLPNVKKKKSYKLVIVCTGH